MAETAPALVIQRALDCFIRVRANRRPVMHSWEGIAWISTEDVMSTKESLISTKEDMMSTKGDMMSTF